MSSDLLLDLLRIYVPILVDGWQRSARTVTTCSAAVEIGTVSLSCTGTPAIGAIGLACADRCDDRCGESTAARRHGPLARTHGKANPPTRPQTPRAKAGVPMVRGAARSARAAEGSAGRGQCLGRLKGWRVVASVSGGRDSAAKSLLCAHNGGVELPQRAVSPTVYSLPRPRDGLAAPHGARSLDVAR